MFSPIVRMWQSVETGSCIRLPHWQAAGHRAPVHRWDAWQRPGVWSCCEVGGHILSWCEVSSSHRVEGVKCHCAKSGHHQLII